MIARDIVRMKGQIEKMTEFCGQLKAVSLRISSISTLNELSNAMEEAGKAITAVSGKLDAQKLAEMAKTLSKEDAKLDMKQEMMTEILDGIGESMDDPNEQQKIYEQVLKEVGLEVEDSFVDAGTKKVGAAKVEEKKEEVAEEDSLDAMLKSLQK
jgi:charged multivesicular body protein 2B